jgi:hypothetical protein
MLFASLILSILSVTNSCFFTWPKLTDGSPSLIYWALSFAVVLAAPSMLPRFAGAARLAVVVA